MDEFAFRRGVRYGTILVGIEARRPVDVLPDRTSETLAAWLREHPGAEVVCRDRASASTRAVKEAAPNAIEVADRWHLLRDLSLAVEKTCREHRASQALVLSRLPHTRHVSAGASSGGTDERNTRSTTAGSGSSG